MKGKQKGLVYATDDPKLLIVSYKDDATAFHGLKRGTIAGKGIINNKMSNDLMRLLNKEGICLLYTSPPRVRCQVSQVLLYADRYLEA